MACEDCDRVLDQNNALMERANDNHDQREALIDQLVTANRKIGALKAELTKLRQDSPKMDEANEVFSEWVRVLAKNKRATFGPERQAKVIARLKEPALTDGERKLDLFRAIEGCERVPFVGPRGRQATAEKGAKRHDDLALICRDETTVERFVSYADEFDVKVTVAMADVLERAFPGTVERRPDWEPCPPFVFAVCPACEGELWLWRGRVRCNRGCEAEDVKGTLREIAKPTLAVAA